MSSPLALLRKRRSRLDVLGARQSWSSRGNVLQEATAELKPSDPRPSRAHGPDASTIPPQRGAPPSDMELLSAMMKRVTFLEATVGVQAKELKLKDKKISALEKREQSTSDSSEGGPAGLRARSSLEQRCEHLQKQVWEMESFLNDYGLIWVGDAGGSDSAAAAKHDGSASSLGVNFDLLLRRIRELNVIAGEGESFVRSTATGAQLAPRESVRLSLYRDGMVMCEGPFRSYQEREAQQFVQDLMDGYFPSELQSRFPDGIPFQVHDRRHEEFISRLAIPGERARAGRFQHRLPKVVIKDGQVINNTPADALQGSSPPTQRSLSVVVDTAALRVDRERAYTSSPDLVTLKIKSEDGNHAFILKMRFSETIGHLRRYLDEYRGSGFSDYDIVSAQPPRCYSDESQTLGCCGITSNSTLLLQRRKC